MITLKNFIKRVISYRKAKKYFKQIGAYKKERETAVDVGFQEID